jgi:hypothetical protein
MLKRLVHIATIRLKRLLFWASRDNIMTVAMVMLLKNAFSSLCGNHALKDETVY